MSGMRLGLLIFALLFSAAATEAASTYCNPLDLDYKYNFEETWRNISYRSGADPVLLHHAGEYFLFSTIADGYWHSPDLRTWRHVKPQGWPERDMVAPAAISAKGAAQRSAKHRPAMRVDPYPVAVDCEIHCTFRPIVRVRVPGDVAKQASCQPVPAKLRAIVGE